MLSDYARYTEKGRLIDVTVHSGYSIHYWVDHADEQVKVSKIRQADR